MRLLAPRHLTLAATLALAVSPHAQTLSFADLNPGSEGSMPTSFTPFDGNLYFQARDETNGGELWRTDGTPGGARIVKDIQPGLPGGIPFTIDGTQPELVVFEDALYFFADDGTSGKELWRTDGTADGTQLVKDINPGDGGNRPRGLTVAGDLLFFIADDGTTGDELWRTDGTADGTQLVKDINPGGADGYDLSFPQLVFFDGALYFEADDGTHGLELWRSDGTTDGTQLFRDLNPGAGPGRPYDFTAFDGALYFGADDGVNGYELWRTDGTAEGTEFIVDIAAGSENSFPADFRELDGVLYFKANDRTVGGELWRTDGTASGTQLVKDIRPGSSSSLAFLTLIAFDGALYFEANDGTNGWELWTTDGTTDGTRLVRDIASGSGDGVLFSDYAPLGNLLYFVADDGETGKELWQTDGTTDGTAIVADLWEGSIDSDPDELSVFEGALYFRANNGRGIGRELWKLGGIPLPAEADPSASVALAVWPNPMVVGTGRVRLTAETPQHIEVALYDALGRHVASLFDGPAGPGQVIEAALPTGLTPGMYLVHARTEAGTLTRSVAVAQ